jgi:hypothetical protein
MNFTAFRTVLAVITLSFATRIFVLNYIPLSIRIKNKIRKTNHRVPSGIALVTVILAALSLSIGRQSEMVCYWALSIIAFGPMNWIILAAILREVWRTVTAERRGK